jgi:hypothetical protein
MASKKQKAAIAITFTEVRCWVLAYIKTVIVSQGHHKPTDLWDIQAPSEFLAKPYSKNIFKWLTDPKHLYNTDGAIELMMAALGRIK